MNSKKTIIGSDITNEVDVRRLVREIKEGNQQAFTELCERFHNQVTAQAYKIVNDYDEAADIAQIVFMKVARNIWRYDEKRKFFTWLYRITMNASIDYIRKHHRHRHEQLEDFHDVIEGNDVNPELDYHRRQLETFIEKATQSLNEKQRSAFILRDVEGRKIDAVADNMNMPEATVRWYLHRARNKIRKELKRKCPQLLLLLGIK